MNLQKIGKYYHVRIRSQNGEHVRVSTKATTKKEARQMVKDSGLEKLELAARTHRLTRDGIARIITGQKITILQCLDHYADVLGHIGRAPRSIENAVQDVHRFARDLDIEKSSPATIDEKMIHRWINNPEMKAKLSYRRVMLSHISSFFQFCAREGFCLGDPTELVRVSLNALTHDQKEKRKVLTFTDDEIQKIINNTEGFWKFATALSWETSLRLTDVCQIEWACFENPGEVAVWTDKRDKRVAVPISETIQKMLNEIPVMDAHYLFPAQRAIALDLDRRALLSVQFKRICARLDIHGKTFHGIRHTTITRWWNEGKSLEDIGRLVGHANKATTERYVHA